MKPCLPSFSLRPAAKPLRGRTAVLAFGLLAALGPALAQSNAATAPRIQPQDGYWSWDIGKTETTGTCMPGIAEKLAQLLPRERNEQMRFEHPFDPQQLIRHSMIKWEQPAPNHFIATAVGASIHGFPLPMNIRYDLYVISPTEMRGDGSVQMNVWQPCAVSAPFVFLRVGASATDTKQTQPGSAASAKGTAARAPVTPPPATQPLRSTAPAPAAAPAAADIPGPAQPG